MLIDSFKQLVSDEKKEECTIYLCMVDFSGDLGEWHGLLIGTVI